MTTTSERLVTTERAPGRRSGKRRTAQEREARAGYVLVAPTTILLAVFYLYPLAQTVFYSFTDWNPATGSIKNIIGFSNFTAVLTAPDFLQATRNTALYVIVVVPCSMALGLVLAALLASPIRGRSIYRTLIFTPYIAPIIGSALIFSYMLSPLGGIVNNGLQLFGVAPIGFLNTQPWAIITIIVFSIWQLVGYTMIIYSAALSSVPPSYHEAATLDGAGPLRRFFSISLPLVAPTSAFLAVTGVVSSLQVFTQVYVLTRGGPVKSTQTLLYWIYQQGFIDFNGGSASAGAVILLIIGIVISVTQLWIQSRRDTVELT